MWQIEHQHAVWKSRRLSARVHLTHPESGLHCVRLGTDEWIGASIHEVSLPCADSDAWEFIDDAYVRENDLLVTYRESAFAALRTQLQWRVQELSGTLILLELTASVQTPCRECDPRIRISTSMPTTYWQILGGETECVWDLATRSTIDQVAIRVAEPGVVLVHSADESGPCLAQAIPASDLVDAGLERNRAKAGSVLAQTYFAHRLEKGVLRRVRLQAYVATNSRALEAVQSTALQSLHQSPPLVA